MADGGKNELGAMVWEAGNHTRLARNPLLRDSQMERSRQGRAAMAEARRHAALFCHDWLVARGLGIVGKHALKPAWNGRFRPSCLPAQYGRGLPAGLPANALLTRARGQPPPQCPTYSDSRGSCTYTTSPAPCTMPSASARRYYVNANEKCRPFGRHFERRMAERCCTVGHCAAPQSPPDALRMQSDRPADSAA